MKTTFFPLDTIHMLHYMSSERRYEDYAYPIWQYSENDTWFEASYTAEPDSPACLLQFVPLIFTPGRAIEERHMQKKRRF